MEGRRKGIDMSIPAGLPTPADRPLVSSLGLAIGELIQLRTEAAEASNNPVRLREIQKRKDELLIDTVITAGLSGKSYPGLRIGFKLDTPDDQELQVIVTGTYGARNIFRTRRTNPTLTEERAALLARASFRAGLSFQGSSSRAPHTKQFPRKP